MFKIAEPTNHLKILVWGEYKVGKTTFAMQLPKACIVDLEKGSLQYQKKMGVPGFVPKNGDFEGIYHSCVDAVKQGFETIIIDQLSTLYEWHLKRWSDLLLQNEPKSKGNKRDYYNFQPSDYGHIKRTWRDYIQSLLNLDANIVGIARSKPLYAEGAMMKKIGDTYDCEKNLAYEFDYIMQIRRNGQQRFCLLEQRCIDKERQLPHEFALSDAPGHFKRLLGVGQPQPEKKNPQAVSSVS